MEPQSKGSSRPGYSPSHFLLLRLSPGLPLLRRGREVQPVYRALQATGEGCPAFFWLDSPSLLAYIPRKSQHNPLRTRLPVSDGTVGAHPCGGRSTVALGGEGAFGRSAPPLYKGPGGSPAGAFSCLPLAYITFATPTFCTQKGPLTGAFAFY